MKEKPSILALLEHIMVVVRGEMTKVTDRDSLPEEMTLI